LYVRCSVKVVEGDYCKRCTVNMVSEGRPKHGIFSERISKENWRTDEGKRAITYMEYLKKKGMSREEGESLLGGEKLPESEWELPVRGRRGAATSDTESEGGLKYTARYLPLDSYSGVSPSTKEHAHKGKNGKVLRVYKYTDGIVRKVNEQNWSEEANEKFSKMYGGDGKSEGFENTSKKKGKKHVNDAAIEQMDEMRAMLEKFAAENAALKAEMGKEEKVEVDEKKVEKKRKKSLLMAKKKAAKEEALKKQQEDLIRQQKELQEQMNEEEESEFDSDEEEEVVFNGYDYKGDLYHKDDENRLWIHDEEEDGVYFGYVDKEGEVHEGEDLP